MASVDDRRASGRALPSGAAETPAGPDAHLGRRSPAWTERVSVIPYTHVRPAESSALTYCCSSKLRPPRPTHRDIVRERLLERLIAPDEPPMLLLHAPAGYGKTLLMAQAREECERRGVATAWLSLDEGDRGEAAFVAALEGALQESELPNQDDEVDLLARLGRLQPPLVMFIDDYHRARTTETDRLLAQIATRAALGARFVVASRVRPQTGFAALLVREAVAVLGPDALAFDDGDLEALALTQSISATAEAFVRKADGWPAMLVLARAGAAQADKPSAILSSSPALAEYLDQELLDALGPDELALLHDSAIPDEITPALVACLTDPDDGWPVLEALASRTQLMVRGNGDHYRINPVLRDHLRARLQRSDAARVRLLHARAAHHYLEHGADVAAARHALQSGDSAVIERLLARTSVLRLAFKGGISILGMIKAVRPELSGDLPHLAFAEIYLLLFANRTRLAAEKFRKIRQRTIESSGVGKPGNFMEADALVVEALIDAYTDRFSLEKIKTIEQRLTAMEEADETLLAVVRELKLWGEYWSGNFLASDGVAHFLRPETPDADTTYVEIYGHFALGMSALERGDLDESERHHRRASDLAVVLNGPRASQARTARLLLAEVAYDRNQLERSRNLIDGLLDEVEREDSWFDIFASAYTTASHLAFSQSFDAALGVLDRADVTAARIGLDHLTELATAQRLKLAVMAGKISYAREQYDALAAADLLEAPVTAEVARWRITVPALMAAARFHLATDDPERALARIAQMPIRREGHQQNRRMLEAHLLSAVAHYRLSRWEAAASEIAKALPIAAQTGLERAFIDLGEWLAEPFDWMLRRPSGATDLARRLRPLLDGGASRPTSSSAVRLATPGMLLSTREYEVLVMMATGKTYKEVASDLALSVNTVMTHRKKLYEKLGSNSRSRVLSRARSLGLIP